MKWWFYTTLALVIVIAVNVMLGGL